MSTLLLLLALGSTAPDQTLRLADGLDMAYVDVGKGEPALVLVHCGNCRKEIWRETVDAFASERRVVAMDLPGHGRSGARRDQWSLAALGADVAALVERLKLGKVVLVGNSLGGPVALEAARRLGRGRVLGVVAVDTLQDVEAKWPEESRRRMVDAYQKDFQKACRALMAGLLPKDAPPATRDRIDEETCRNDSRAAVALLGSFGEYDQRTALREAGVPVWAINSTALPTALEANRKYALSFDVILMEGVGHYPQIERPAEFQRHLRRVLETLISTNRPVAPAP